MKSLGPAERGARIADPFRGADRRLFHSRMRGNENPFRAERNAAARSLRASFGFPARRMRAPRALRRNLSCHVPGHGRIALPVLLLLLHVFVPPFFTVHTHTKCKLKTLQTASVLISQLTLNALKPVSVKDQHGNSKVIAVVADRWGYYPKFRNLKILEIYNPKYRKIKPSSIQCEIY